MVLEHVVEIQKGAVDYWSTSLQLAQTLSPPASGDLDPLVKVSLVKLKVRQSSSTSE